MRVYLVRHGIAVHDGYLEDGDRPLTEAGRRQVRDSFARWSGLPDPAPARWLVSPHVRAVQTCEVALSAFGAEGPVEVLRELLPEARVSAAAQLVEDRYGETLAIVAHQPLLGGLAAFLLGLRSVPAAVQPGAVLALELPEGGEAPSLVWHLLPGDDGPRLLVPPRP